MRRVARHPDGSKNKICQRAPVLESQLWLSSNYHCCLAVTLLWEWLQEYTSRKNPELESLRQFVAVLNLILATPATLLVPNCKGPAVPLDPSPTWRERERGGGGGGGRDMLHGQEPVTHITLPRLTSKPLTYLHLLPHLERTLQLRNTRRRNTGINRYR